jgi:arginine decarboxylase
MQIHIATGIGAGPTTLSAFDAALNDAGIANYNLLKLSSVIPPSSEVIVHDKTIDQKIMPGKWGDRLYVVMAEQRVDKPNEEAWAGIGWVQDAKTDKGLFVEHEGLSEKSVRNDITQSLNALMATRNMDLGPIHMKVVGRTCTHHPVSAMVVAVYQASSWDNKSYYCKDIG